MEKVLALSSWQTCDLYTDLERVALEYAEAITYSDRQVSAELMNQVKEHFNEDEIIELTGLIAFQNLSSKFNSALDVPAQGFCELPGSVQ
jgi:alkylhydroperoxidase family enzyme